MKIDPMKLKAKGWKDYEIEHAMNVLKKAEEVKHPRLVFWEKNLLWIFLLVALASNLAASVFLFPIITTNPNNFAYSFTVLIGLTFGALFMSLLLDVESLELKHHLIYSTIIPFVGILNFVVIVSKANTTSSALGIGLTHNPYVLGVVYVVSFFLPYVLLVNGVKPWILKTGV